MPEHKEWFRRSRWSDVDRADFWARLERSRSTSNKAQYLRIQALHLQDVGTPPMLRAALELLDTLISEFPDPLQLSSAYLQQAESLWKLGKHERAIESFRHALQAERLESGIKTDAHLSLGELVVALNRQELYNEVLSVLDEFGGGEIFPVQRYREAMIRSFIADEKGDRSTARQFARDALEAASATESPFRYHRKLGLVTHLDQQAKQRLRELAADDDRRARYIGGMMSLIACVVLGMTVGAGLGYPGFGGGSGVGLWLGLRGSRSTRKSE